MPEDMSQIVTENEKENRYGSTHDLTPTGSTPLDDWFLGLWHKSSRVGY
jgi:hypothetical protein